MGTEKIQVNSAHAFSQWDILTPIQKEVLCAWYVTNSVPNWSFDSETGAIDVDLDTMPRKPSARERADCIWSCRKTECSNKESEND